MTIVSATAFQVQKISTYLRDPNLLLAGDTLRYTITVKNTGSGNAINVVLRDAVPANTTYVAGSTTLNGAKVADVAGASPLVNGMPINSPADPTPGSMPAVRVEHAVQCRNYHVRCGRESEYAERHGDLEPGFCERRRALTSRPTTRARRPPMIRR